MWQIYYEANKYKASKQFFIVFFPLITIIKLCKMKEIKKPRILQLQALKIIQLRTTLPILILVEFPKESIRFLYSK